MAATRFLIVNADDLGQSAAVNHGIIQAHEGGIVTSASLMVRWPTAVEAAALANTHPDMSIGLHVDLGEYAYDAGGWREVYQVVPLDNRDAVEEEVHRQFAAFRRLLERDPTHLDSHQHVHRQEPVHAVLAGIAAQLHIPLRHYSPGINYCGRFYGQDRTGQPCRDGVSVTGLLETLSGLPTGVTELACHPGFPEQRETMYGIERSWELETLCDPRVRSALGGLGIELRSFASLGGADG